ncbi:hypothetical protein [Brevibacillus laterosporus]|uniref:hypothetical protein n=1 Tax=Brevibacillus laterosporus TaxID=1465 RepID=UPI000839C223|nr:hypothetical protein [Brevibacillus laterosporus]
MAKAKEQREDTAIRRLKQDWIESAGQVKAERFELVGALFYVPDTEALTEDQVKEKLARYRGEK